MSPGHRLLSLARHSSGESTKSSPATTRAEALAGQIPAAFLAGVISIITPCVLPLVPGYLSAVSAIEADRLGTPGAARRVALASLPFILGFTVVFVVLGIAAAAIGGILPSDRQLELAGLILVVIGLTFIGLLPWPERLLAPGLLTGARRRNSNILLGAAFAICAAPCIGAVLASILAIATTSSVVKGAVLLAFYSAGLGLAFLLAAVGFTQAMGAFRWLRDHYVAIRVAGGVILVVLGLLLFFHKDWWLNVFLNRLLNDVGLGDV